MQRLCACRSSLHRFPRSSSLLFYETLQTGKEANVCDDNNQEMSATVRSSRPILTNDDDDDDEYYSYQDAPHLQEVNIQQTQMRRHSSEQ